MKDLIVLFTYDCDGPRVTIGGDPSLFAVGLDINDGRAYDLWFYDDDTEACSIAGFGKGRT